MIVTNFFVILIRNRILIVKRMLVSRFWRFNELMYERIVTEHTINFINPNDVVLNEKSITVITMECISIRSWLSSNPTVTNKEMISHDISMLLMFMNRAMMFNYSLFRYIYSILISNCEMIITSFQQSIKISSP